MNLRVRTYDELASTNETVKEALRAGEPEGLVVHAHRQSGGYGRQGRSWASPPGGLYLSLLLRPDVPLQVLPSLSLVVGLAARDAVASFAASDLAERVQVKWPNDVVFASEGSQVSKMCGISLERVGGGVCVGIGVNVRPPAGGTVFADKNRPCYLSEIGGGEASVDGVRDAVLAAFAPRYELWCAEGLAPFLDDYAARSLLAKKAVVIEDIEGSVMVEGRVQGIDEEGRLLVAERESGRVMTVASGEAHISSIATLF